MSNVNKADDNASVLANVQEVASQAAERHNLRTRHGAPRLADNLGEEPHSHGAVRHRAYNFAGTARSCQLVEPVQHHNVGAQAEAALVAAQGLAEAPHNAAVALSQERGHNLAVPLHAAEGNQDTLAELRGLRKLRAERQQQVQELRRTELGCNLGERLGQHVVLPLAVTRTAMKHHSGCLH